MGSEVISEKDEAETILIRSCNSKMKKNYDLSDGLLRRDCRK